MIERCRYCHKKLEKGLEHLKYCSAKCFSIANGNKELKKYERQKLFKLKMESSYRHELHKEQGNMCIICGTTQKLLCHEINGRKHPNLLMRNKTVFLEKGFKFCLICRTCHTILHLLAKRNLSKSQFEKLMELIAQIQK